ncbi:hypothetical protein GGS26DRAFT_595215 [Hypomontagnella submonticulosa]|nr:hypothetical protein GGS26DRAFT_595215 [Hypomontagnella submonticulosa]
MRFSVIVSLLAASATNAVKVPQGISDGVYSVDLSQRAQRRAGAWTLVEEFNATDIGARDLPAADLAARAPLPSPHSQCKTDVKLDGTNLQQARTKFKDRAVAGDQIGKNKALAVVYGSVVYYACSWGGEQPIRVDETDSSDQKMENDCGVAEAGIVIIDAWRKIYGRDNIANEICWGNPWS